MPTSPKIFVVLTVLALVGCSNAPDKVVPKITPEAQAELDKQHAQNKAQLESTAAPAGTAPVGATK